jgi:hypothetical protein
MRRLFRRLTLYFGISAILLLAHASGLHAQVPKVKDFDLDSKRDRSVRFDIAMTPTSDVLSFVANDTGDWELYRASNWLGETPSVRTVTLPGYFSKTDKKGGEKALENLSAKVFVTRDGSYAVCVGSAEWLKRVDGWAVGSATSDDVISVVDLSTFKIVATTRTEKLDLFEFHGVDLDDEGYIRVGSSSSGKVRQEAFIRLSIPALESSPKCAYVRTQDSFGKQNLRPMTDKGCSEILKRRALDDYLRGRQVPSTQTFSVCEKNDSEFCHIPGEFTADGKFGVGTRIEGHDGIFGGWVTTSNNLIIFSSARRIDIGEIKEPTNRSFQVKLTSVGGRDYLLVMDSGTHLVAYELRD